MTSEIALRLEARVCFEFVLNACEAVYIQFAKECGIELANRRSQQQNPLPIVGFLKSPLTIKG